MGITVMKRKDLMDLAINKLREEVDMRAAGTTCPMPGCGALAISFEPADSLDEARAFATDWDFVCSECGSEFTSPRSDLLFQAVPRDWLLSQICHA
jgi:hypothetical protein